MGFWSVIFFALGIALLFTLLFSSGYRRDDAWSGLFFFFLLIFLATWAAGYWVTPFGPAYLGVAWLPLLVVGFIFALLLAALAEPQSRLIRRRRINQEEPAAEAALDIFFWIIILIFIFIILFGFFTAV